jgi:hypothetical protein
LATEEPAERVVRAVRLSKEQESGEIRVGLLAINFLFPVAPCKLPEMPFVGEERFLQIVSVQPLPSF